MTWLDDMVRFAHGQLDDRCREELLGRGVTPEQADQFCIGYLDGRLPELGCTKEFTQWCREAPRRIEDVFVLPMTNTLGQVKGFQVRAVTKERKGYQEFAVSTGEPALFGLGEAADAIWHKGEVLLVEGAFDLFPLQRFVPQIVATQTARVPDSLIPTLRRIVHRVWIGYDMDATGARGAQRFEKQHGTEFELRRLDFPGARLPDGKLVKDPGEVWEAWGDERLGLYLKERMV